MMFSSFSAIRREFAVSANVFRCLSGKPDVHLSTTSSAASHELLVPSSDIGVAGSVPPGFASPSTFPSRGFSPPQGFASRNSLWPCFMPLPLIGF
jgi:hypothetical protein